MIRTGCVLLFVAAGIIYLIIGGLTGQLGFFGFIGSVVAVLLLVWFIKSLIKNVDANKKSNLEEDTSETDCFC